MTDIFDIDPVRGFAKGIPDSFGPLFGKDVVNLCDEVDRLRVLVSEMTLHSLGCSGKVGTDGVECEWPEHGPCLVAALRSQIRDLADELDAAKALLVKGV